MLDCVDYGKSARQRERDERERITVLKNEADALFDMLDVNGDGVLDREEWVAGVDLAG